VKTRNGLMGLSELGCMAWYFWRQIPAHQDNTILDSFIVMPNHVHGIVGIVQADLDNHDVGTCHGMSLPNTPPVEFGKPQSKSLSMIINHYKGALTR